jgi:uncharacterized protein
MEQTWYDLLFLHWNFPPEQIRPLIPAQLTLDLLDGRAWVAVVPFGMRGIRRRGMPELPGLSKFLELNVRTYVVCEGRPGVYFFSLDAASLPAVWAARGLYKLPYFFARMDLKNDSQRIYYSSKRIHEPAPAEFRGRYQPLGPATIRERGSAEHWLTERYCLYTVAKDRVYRGEIHHLPWPLQDASAEIEENSMAAAAGITLPAHAPLAHFAHELQVLIWPLQPVQ